MKVVLDLTKINGNAFALMGAFSRAAQRQGFDLMSIDAVLKECRGGDYNHLVSTLQEHCRATK